MTLGPSPVTRVSGCIATATGNREETDSSKSLFPPLQAAAEWTRGDLNPRPRRCKRRALPAELRAPHTDIGMQDTTWHHAAVYFISTCECILYVDTVTIVRFIETTAYTIPLDVLRGFWIIRR